MRSGDIEVCRDQEVTGTTPQSFREAYQQYMQGGWSGLCAKEADGGQELPMITSAIMGEMLGGSNISWALYPRLSESEEHTSELQSRGHLVCRLLLEKKNGEDKFDYSN